MAKKYGQAKYGTFRYGVTPLGVSFQIKISDSSGNLKMLANNEFELMEWSFLDQGGCDKAKIRIKRSYDDLSYITATTKQEIYNLQIIITENFGETAKRYWQGEIVNIRPTLRDSEGIDITAVGYVERLKKIQIHSNGEPVEYTSTTIEDVVDTIFDNYIATNTSITLDAIDSFGVAISAIKFNGSVYEALKKLGDIVNAEWGVNRDLEFYFYQRSSSSSDKTRFLEGVEIEKIDDEYDWQPIVNSVIVEGGEVNDKPLRVIVENTESKNAYGLMQDRINDSSIVSEDIASQLGSTYLEKHSQYKRNFRVTLPLNNRLIEESLPIPLGIIVKNPRPNLYKYATFKYGQKKYSGEETYRIRKIFYEINDTSIRTEIDFSDGKPSLDTRLERLLFQLEQQRQSQGV